MILPVVIIMHEREIAAPPPPQQASQCLVTWSVNSFSGQLVCVVAMVNCKPVNAVGDYCSSGCRIFIQGLHIRQPRDLVCMHCGTKQTAPQSNLRGSMNHTATDHLGSLVMFPSHLVFAAKDSAGRAYLLGKETADPPPSSDSVHNVSVSVVNMYAL